jgi:hypothetical protein
MIGEIDVMNATLNAHFRKQGRQLLIRPRRTYHDLDARQRSLERRAIVQICDDTLESIRTDRMPACNNDAAMRVAKQVIDQQAAEVTCSADNENAFCRSY